jgi:hypothetical protein
MASSNPKHRPGPATTEEVEDGKKKRPRLEEEHLVCDNVIGDALELVMAYLAPKELFRLTFTCKALQKRVTTKMVVRSAMIHGGNPKQNILELYPLMKDQSIHVPSPVRLLRLVNGKKCEKKNCRAKVKHVRPGTGVFLCWDCLTRKKTGFTKAFDTKWVRYRMNSRYEEIFSHPRVGASRRYGTKYYLWNRPFMSSDGAMCGPLVMFDDVERAAASKNPIEEELFSDAPAAEEYKEFVDSYDNAVEEAREMDLLRERKKKEASKNAVERRRENAKKLIGKIRNLLDERWRDFMLEYTIREQSQASKTVAPVRFKVSFCDHLLDPYVLAPSKAKKSDITDLAAQINHTMEKIAKFLDFDFLLEEELFERALKSHCLQKFPDLKSLITIPRFRRFTESMSSGDVFQALEMIFASDYSDHYSGTFQANFGLTLINSDDDSDSARLADSVWSCCARNGTKKDVDDRRKFCNQVFLEAKDSFEEAKALISEFMDWCTKENKCTKEKKNRDNHTDDDDNDNDRCLSYRKSFCYKNYGFVEDLLRKKDYEELRMLILGIKDFEALFE